jgi:Zn(II)-responsive transcriptional regulator
MEGLTIGRIAKGAGIGIETVRFYEKEGLIDPPARTRSNYRIYPQSDMLRLRFIKRAKKLGFTLKEIKELLSLQLDPQATKAEVKQQTEAKIADIELKIKDLTRMKEVLESLDACCNGQGPTSDCPILGALETGHGLDEY